ncbi:CDP-glycerol glycerophosphotransferase family protein [Paeniglutamicibacter sp. NPDC012692]|uniref:CDP-glycerol glycerophosphotransferase family protein n=1 Tax=Paeniglutamicibacter sp. NPDC012692 TaxID=3364388 RepID=UPI0036859E12
MHYFSKLMRIATMTARKVNGSIHESSIRRNLNRTSLPFGETCDFVVYFADPLEQIYQVTQWIKPLESLSSNAQTVGFVIADPFVARELAKQTSLPIFLTRSMESYENFVLERRVRGVFYVNNSQANFTALRITSPTHIHLNHGESDKISMVSNQLKAYDFAFVAGDAAVERIRSSIRRFDTNRLATIGRPQLDSRLENPTQRNTSRIEVLYAPTWEGDSRHMAYGSLPSIGPAVIEELLSDKRFTVVFRPHPKSGTWSKETRKALNHVEDRVSKAAALDPLAGHRTDRTSDATAAMLNSDVIIADNSAMTMDAVGLDKPVLLSMSDAMRRQSRNSPSTQKTVEALRHIGPENVGKIAELVAEVAAAPIPQGQAALRERVFGAESLGTGTERFIRAAKQAIEDPAN